MNGMVHDLPNVVGIDPEKASQKITQVLPGYMPMGDKGMSDMDAMDVGRPSNTLPMATAGPYGFIEMGGMFTLLKVRPGITRYTDPGWYRQPPEPALLWWVLSSPRPLQGTPCGRARCIRRSACTRRENVPSAEWISFSPNPNESIGWKTSPREGAT